jgi:predicted histone-like DNA-binding protein
MALKVKAVERNLKFSKDDPGIWRYVMQPELYSSLAEGKVIREAALRSGVSEGVMKACWDAAGEVIKAWLPEGHSVPLPGLGTARFGLSAKTVENVNDVKTGLIKTRRIVFTPAVELKDELKSTAIVITCYDRDGKEVKRVTSTDPGTVEDNADNGNDNGVDNTGGSSQSGSGSNSGNSGSGSGSSQSGSQSQQNSVAAPTISGVNPFEETSQVSISGPDGATIYYSENGDDPDSNDTLYTQPFTIDETTTIKAIAIKDGVSSQVTTKVFTKGTGGSGDFETGS